MKNRQKKNVNPIGYGVLKHEIQVLHQMLTTVFSIFIINTVKMSIAKFFSINTNWTGATGTSAFALIWQTFSL